MQRWQPGLNQASNAQSASCTYYSTFLEWLLNRLTAYDCTDTKGPRHAQLLALSNDHGSLHSIFGPNKSISVVLILSTAKQGSWITASATLPAFSLPTCDPPLPLSSANKLPIVATVLLLLLQDNTILDRIARWRHLVLTPYDTI